MNGECGCSGFLKHLQVEHRQLNQLLRDLDRHVALWSDNAANPSPEIIDKIEELKRMLLAHFAEEEGGGCLEEAVARCPQLAPRRVALEAEHRDLQRQLEALVEHARHPRVPAPHMPTAFRAFADQLRAHEAGESEVLEMAFGGDASDFDSEGTY